MIPIQFSGFTLTRNALLLIKELFIMVTFFLNNFRDKLMKNLKGSADTSVGGVVLMIAKTSVNVFNEMW